MIYLNGAKFLEKDNKNNYTFSDGQKYKGYQIKNIECECEECHKIKILKRFRTDLFTTPYICNSCRLTGERNPFYGHKHTEEFKKQRSLERKGKWGLGKNNGFYGCKHTQETINKIKSKLKGYDYGEEHRQKIKTWFKNNPDKVKEIRKKCKITVQNRTPERTKEIHEHMKVGALKAKLTPNYYENKRKAAKLSFFSQSKNYKMNNFEKTIDNWLTEHNIEHNYSVIMSDSKRNYQFDFIVRHKRILIECQGTFWHADPRFFKKENLRENQILKIKSDEQKRIYAREHNFNLIEVWEHDIMTLKDYKKLEDVLL